MNKWLGETCCRWVIVFVLHIGNENLTFASYLVLLPCVCLRSIPAWHCHCTSWSTHYHRPMPLCNARRYPNQQQRVSRWPLGSKRWYYFSCASRGGRGGGLYIYSSGGNIQSGTQTCRPLRSQAPEACCSGKKWQSPPLPALQVCAYKENGGGILIVQQESCHQSASQLQVISCTKRLFGNNLLVMVYQNQSNFEIPPRPGKNQGWTVHPGYSQEEYKAGKQNVLGPQGSTATSTTSEASGRSL